MHIYNIKHVSHKNLGGLQPPQVPLLPTPLISQVENEMGLCCTVTNKVGRCLNQSFLVSQVPKYVSKIRIRSENSLEERVVLKDGIYACRTLKANRKDTRGI